MEILKRGVWWGSSLNTLPWENGYVLDTHIMGMMEHNIVQFIPFTSLLFIAPQILQYSFLCGDLDITLIIAQNILRGRFKSKG